MRTFRFTKHERGSIMKFKMTIIVCVFVLLGRNNFVQHTLYEVIRFINWKPGPLRHQRTSTRTFDWRNRCASAENRRSGGSIFPEFAGSGKAPYGRHRILDAGCFAAAAPVSNPGVRPPARAAQYDLSCLPKPRREFRNNFV